VVEELIIIDKKNYNAQNICKLIDYINENNYIEKLKNFYGIFKVSFGRLVVAPLHV
jgi:hypothetical protein